MMDGYLGLGPLTCITAFQCRASFDSYYLGPRRRSPRDKQLIGRPQISSVQRLFPSPKGQRSHPPSHLHSDLTLIKGKL
jgi:hypothetical protein